MAMLRRELKIELANVKVIKYNADSRIKDSDWRFSKKSEGCISTQRIFKRKPSIIQKLRMEV